MTLEYKIDRIPPSILLQALEICAADIEWWYVEECEVTNTHEHKVDELSISQEEYYKGFSDRIVEIRRDEFSRFLDVHDAQFENLRLVGSRNRLDPTNIVSLGEESFVEIVIEYRDVGYCIISVKNQATAARFQQHVPGFEITSKHIWRNCGPW